MILGLYTWSLFNRLTINFDKSKFQIVCAKSKLADVQHVKHLTIGDKHLERVDTVNYLGIILQMNFEKASLFIDCT